MKDNSETETKPTTCPMNLFHLTLKKKWFDMILSGEKKEEYREMTPYWTSRFCNNPLSYTHGKFRNGYRKDAPWLIAEIKMIGASCGERKWGGNGKPVHTIWLGKIIESNAELSYPK